MAAKSWLQRGTSESRGWKYHMHWHCTMDTLVNITKLHPLKGWVRTSDFNKLEFKKKPVTPKQRHYLAGKGPYSESYGFSSSHGWMWEVDHKETRAQKNWCFWTVVLEKTLESPLDCKEIQPVHSKWDQPWVFFGRNDAKAEIPVLWLPHEKSWLIGKDSDAERDWGQEEKETTEDGMAGWHHWLNGCESEWTPGVGDGRGGLVCCDSWGRKESDTTERLNWTEWIFLSPLLFST